MTDYFAILNQPRRPWLDLAELKKSYHQSARRSAVDQQTNHAYQILLDPRSRLEHLLALEGAAAARLPEAVPAELTDLFMEIAPLLKAGGGAQDLTSINGMVARLEKLREQALAALVETDRIWMAHRPEAIEQSRALYQRLSYLGRWLDLLREKHFTLSA